jgi:hypothetical protein
MPKRVLLLLMIFFAVSKFTFAQEADTIVIKRGITVGLPYYEYQNKKITFRKLVAITDGNQQASYYSKKAISQHRVSNLFGGIGGFIVGVSIPILIMSNNPQPALIMMAGGATMITFSLPFGILSKRNMKKSVIEYNRTN